MARDRASRLAPVVDMAQRAERAAAVQLARAQGQLTQAEVKLGELERYRSDYQQQWLQSGRQGVSGEWLMNYQRFLSQLEQAISQQAQAMRTSTDRRGTFAAIKQIDALLAEITADIRDGQPACQDKLDTIRDLLADLYM